jgi:hypothetical protein
MRLAVVILALAAIAVTLVHIRRSEATVRHEIQDLRTAQVSLRRQLWDRQVRAGQLTAPSEVRRRVGEMALDMVDKYQPPPKPAERGPVRTARGR